MPGEFCQLKAMGAALRLRGYDYEAMRRCDWCRIQDRGQRSIQIAEDVLRRHGTGQRC